MTSAAAGQVATTTTINAPAAVPAGVPLTITGQVLSGMGGPVAGAQVQVTHTFYPHVYGEPSSAQSTVTTGVDGTFTLTLTPAAGTHAVKAVYAGDATYTASASTDASFIAAKDETTLALAATRSSGLRTTFTASGSRTPLQQPTVAWAGATVRLQQYEKGKGWQDVKTLTLDSTGTATWTTRADVSSSSRWRAAIDAGDTYQGAVSDTVSVAAYGPQQVSLSGPRTIVDERTGTLKVRVRPAGKPVKVAVQQRQGGWKTVGHVTTNRDGKALVKVSPRTASSYRVTVQSSGKTLASRTVTVEVTPVIAPVRLPAASPRPRISLPAQPRATTPGADPVITRIDDRTWASMVGRSWHAGCPVGRDGLRLLRVNYFGYDGYRHRGELVVATRAAQKMARGLSGLYRAQVPIRSMYRVDRFGWSERVNGADDYASMAAGNTSAFNCRDVVGRPGRTSPHALGRSLDINPWENPYRSKADGWVPNSAWAGRPDAGKYTWRSRTDLVVRTLAAAGLRWTYGTDDIHHFDA